MTWSAAQYVAFEAERTRPVRDLLAAVPDAEVRRAVDIGCGPGNSTEVLAARYPAAVVSGLDSSPEMIEAARTRLPQVRFALVDITRWDDPGPFGVILANAVLQWVPDHAALLPTLLGKLALGGSLAVQVPDNLEEPAHREMRALAHTAAWSGKLAGAERPMGSGTRRSGTTRCCGAGADGSTSGGRRTITSWRTMRRWWSGSRGRGCGRFLGR